MSLEQKIEELTVKIDEATTAYKQCITAMGKFAKQFENSANTGTVAEADTSEEDAAAKKKAEAAAKRKAAAAKKKEEAEAKKKAAAEAEKEEEDDDLDFLGEEDEPAEEVVEATKEQVVEALQAFAKADKKNPPKAKKLLEKFGAANISQLNKDDYQAVLDALAKVSK